MNGVTYKRLRGNIGPQLPCPDEDHPGTERLFQDWRFPRPDGRAALLPRDYKIPDDMVDEEYPFVLITGRLRGQFNTRTRTGRSQKLNKMAPDAFVDIHPEDASDLDISEGQMVEIISRRGSLRLPVRLTDRNRTGNIFIPWHYGYTLGVGKGKSANLLTGTAYDVHSRQPEYKFTAVNIQTVRGRRKSNNLMQRNN